MIKFNPVDIPVLVYPLPTLLIVIEVTTPAVTKAVNAAPTPIVELIETKGLDK